jgi:hypothetical protein
MGCDIHAALQRKKKGSSEWELVYDIDEGPANGFGYQPEVINGVDYGWSSPLYGRSYKFFSFIAGVRNYGYNWWPIGKTNGWPEDFTHVHSDMWHSHSHITLEQLKIRLAKAVKIEETASPAQIYDFKYWYNTIENLIGSTIDKDYNYRLIFAFDS